jgi:hypothetical protein
MTTKREKDDEPDEKPERPSRRPEIDHELPKPERPRPKAEPPTIKTDGDEDKPFTVFLWGEGDTYTPVAHSAERDYLIPVYGKGCHHIDEMTTTGAWIYRQDVK